MICKCLHQHQLLHFLFTNYSNRCIGLAPVRYGLPYLPAFVQVLFHIPVIHQAVLSFQPTSYDWGSPRYYWCGESDQIPTYPDITSQSSTTPPPSLLIDIGDDDDPSNSTSVNDIHQNSNLPKSSLGKDTSSFDRQHLELIPHYVFLLAFCELQRLFGFLSFSNRGYGSVKQLMHTLEQENIACLTQSMDIDVDGNTNRSFICSSNNVLSFRFSGKDAALPCKDGGSPS